MAIPEIPSISDIKDRIISDIEGEINQTTPALPKSLNRIIASALAGLFFLCYQAIMWVYRQIFPQTSDYPFLILHGAIVGLNPISAIAAVIVCDVPGTTGGYVYQGYTFVGSNGIIYKVNATVEIIAGVAEDVSMTALTAGDVGNLADGEELSITSTTANIDGIATVTSTTIYGYDKESDESYRTRVIARYKKRLQGGSPADYNLWGLECPNFIWVGPYADPALPGVIVVYGKVDNQTDGIPTSNQLTSLLNYLKFDPETGKAYRRPIGDILTTAPITIQKFDIEVSIKDGTPEIKADIENSIIEYVSSLEPYIEGVSDIRKDTLTNSNVSNVASDISEIEGSTIISVSIYVTLTGDEENRYTFYGSEFGKVNSVTFIDVV